MRGVPHFNTVPLFSGIIGAIVSLRDGVLEAHGAGDAEEVGVRAGSQESHLSLLMCNHRAGGALARIMRRDHRMHHLHVFGPWIFVAAAVVLGAVILGMAVGRTGSDGS